LYSDDGSRVFVDGQLVVDNDGRSEDGSAKRKTGAITLSAGYHDLRVEYFQDTDAGYIVLAWDPAGGEAYDLIPESLLVQADQSPERSGTARRSPRHGWDERPDLRRRPAGPMER